MMQIKKKTKRQLIYEHIQRNGPMTGADAAKGLGFPRGSTVSTVAHMTTAGLLHAVGEVPSRYNVTRIYDVVKGVRFTGKDKRNGRQALEIAIESSFHVDVMEGESQRDAKIRTHDEYKGSLCAMVSKLGSGPFGLMAAQLGVGA